MVVDECDSISGSELEHRVVEDRPEIEARPELARSVEVVVQRDVEECDLVIRHSVIYRGRWEHGPPLLTSPWKA